MDNRAVLIINRNRTGIGVSLYRNGASLPAIFSEIFPELGCILANYML